jgi:plasmid stabilization system protein ParE
MRNLAAENQVLSGTVYMVEMLDGEISSFRVLSETPTHYIFSYSTDETVVVFEKAKNEVSGIFEVREWWDTKGRKKGVEEI